MKKKILTTSIILMMLCSATVLVKRWTVDAENSSVSFELPAHHKKGTFRNLNAVIEFDEKNLADSKIKASIDVKTIHSDSEKHDAHLRSPDFFDAEKFPFISFASTEIVKAATGYVAKGNLTMKDSIKPVEIPFIYTEDGKGKAVFNGTMTIHAADYGVLRANQPDADKVLVYLVVPVSE